MLNVLWCKYLLSTALTNKQCDIQLNIVKIILRKTHCILRVNVNVYIYIYI